MRNSLAVIAVCLLLLYANDLAASLPVKVTITGCVKEGVLISEKTDFGTHASDGAYTIKALTSDGRAIDLTAHEGKRISLSGSLLPADRFYPEMDTLKVLGPCLPQADAVTTGKRTIEEQNKLAEELYSVMAKTDEQDIETFKKLHGRVIDECPDTEKAPESLWRLSNLYLLSVDPPDYRRSIPLLERLASEYPESPLVPNAKHRLIIAYKETGNWKKAVELYREAFSRYPEALDDPDMSAVVLDYAEVLAKTGDADRARKLYLKVLTLGDKTDDWLLEIAKEGLASLGMEPAHPPQISEEDALKAVWELPEVLQRASERIRARGALASTRMDKRPRPGSAPGDKDAAYVITFGEELKSEGPQTLTFRIDAYSAKIQVYDPASDVYTELEEWRRAQK